METLEDRTERLLKEKAALLRAFEHPGTQMIFLKLKDAAKASMYDYDNCDFATDRGREMAHRIQARRYVILQEIPRMIDEIINVDIPREENGKRKYKFSLWLEQKREEIKRFFRF